MTGRQTDLALVEHFWLGRLWHSLLWWSTGTSTHLLAGAALHLFSTEGRHTWGGQEDISLPQSLSVLPAGGPRGSPALVLDDNPPREHRDTLVLSSGEKSNKGSNTGKLLRTCQLQNLTEIAQLIPGKVMAVGLFVVLVVSRADFLVDSLALLLVVCGTFLI